MADFESIRLSGFDRPKLLLDLLLHCGMSRSLFRNSRPRNGQRYLVPCGGRRGTTCFEARTFKATRS